MHDAAVDVGKRLEADRKDLLDLSLRNPLLNYRPRARGLQFVGESPVELFRILVREGRSMTFLPAPEPAPPAPGDDPAPPLGLPPADPTDLKLQTDLPAEELQARLLATYHAARTAVEEQGVNTLFLALGLLTWHEDDDPRPLRAPLILVPVALERPSARARFRLRREEGDFDVNLSLAEKLRAGFGLTLPDVPEADELDVAAYCDAVASAVAEQPAWGVDRDAAVLGFFSFGKFLMYRDLEASSWPEGSGPRDHPVVGALLGDGFHEPPPDDGPADPSAGLRLVLDADATQSLALADAAAGRSLVIQGPPGTGKSQTITNLIAEAIGRGRTVLFVAEKLAALEVVKRRLDAAGLGDACLELHSHKTGKKAVLDQLRKALGAGRPRPGPPDEDLARRDELRDRLDAYAEAINEPIGATGVTPHQAIGELLRLGDGGKGPEAARLDLSSLPGWSTADYRRRLDLVESLQVQLSAPGGLRSRPFFGSRRAAWLPGDEERLRDRLRVAYHATAALRATAAALARFLRLPEPATRSACDLLLRAAHMAVEAARWGGALITGDWLAARDDLRELLDAGQALAILHRRLDPVILPETWDLDLRDLRLVLNTRGRRWGRWLDGDYRRAEARLVAVCRTVPPARRTTASPLLTPCRTPPACAT